jgi:hypothetical protein
MVQTVGGIRCVGMKVSRLAKVRADEVSDNENGEIKDRTQQDPELSTKQVKYSNFQGAWCP